MNPFITKVCAVALTAVLATNQGITDAQNKKNDLEKQKANTESMIKDLKSLQSDVSAYVEELDKNLSQLGNDIAALEVQINELEGQIAQKEVEIASVEETYQKEFEDMKLRIKYMYEKSDTTFLDMLFSAKSLSELLNKSEYVEKISVYDRTKLDEYEATAIKLKEAKAELENEKAKVIALKEETEAKRSDVNKLMDEKKNELANYDNQIGDAKNALAQYEKAIKEQEDTIKAIEAEIKRKEEEARKAAEAAGKAVKTVDLGSLSFTWPCPSSSRITSYFGDREQPVAGASTNHKGIDIGSSTGNAIVAAESGEVIIAQYSASAGNYVMISHGGGCSTVYMHCSELCCSVGDQVSKGQTIAKVGSTGYSTGPHLHFGIRANGNYVNPIAYVSP